MTRQKTDTRPLKSRDVAILLDCSPDDVVSWANSGKLRGTKKGRYWLFDQRDVIRFQKNFEPTS